MLESIQLENRIVAESVTGLRGEMREMRTEMTRRFETLEAAVLELGLRVKALEARVGAVEEAVRKNSEDIRKNSEDIRKNSEDIQRLREQLAELSGIVRGKAEAKDVAALAERVARLEARVGL